MNGNLGQATSFLNARATNTTAIAGAARGARMGTAGRRPLGIRRRTGQTGRVSAAAV
ncbi:hypothetical protein ACFQFG_17555 [Methylobacterium persicinum]